MNASAELRGVLERIATPAARVILDRLAQGHPHDLTAQSARTALARLETTKRP